MKPIFLEELKRIELDLLKSFVSFCEKKGLSYFLCGGTALGAVRHEGFIPWDDDIDVMMPRDDYESFIRNYSEEFFSVYTCWNHSDYYYPFAKLVDNRTLIHEKTKMNSNIGIYIDVFPIEKLPNNPLLRNRVYLRRWFLRNQIFSKTALDKKRSFFKSVALSFFGLFARKKNLNSLAKEYDLFARKQYKRSDKYQGKVIWGYGKREIMPAQVYLHYELRSFEGCVYHTPGDTDLYLSRLFGDYMKLPPQEARVLKHDFKAYWK